MTTIFMYPCHRDNQGISLRKLCVQHNILLWFISVHEFKEYVCGFVIFKRLQLFWNAMRYCYYPRQGATSENAYLWLSTFLKWSKPNSEFNIFFWWHFKTFFLTYIQIVYVILCDCYCRQSVGKHIRSLI